MSYSITERPINRQTDRCSDVAKEEGGAGGQPPNPPEKKT